MRRTASVLFLGLFAAGAALQGAAACSSNSTTPSASEDSGIASSNDAETTKDTSTPIQTTSCSSPVAPVMTVTGPDGGQIAPDWSCYGPDAGFLRPLHPVPFDSDASDDGGVDASDSSAPDAADSAPPVDAAPPVDSSTPPPDASPPEDAGTEYALELSDFVSTAPPVGATVNLVWGGSTLGKIAFTGTVDSAGKLFFPPPPVGTELMSYNVVGSSDGDAGPGQAPLWWLAIVPIAPPGVTQYNSLSRDNLTSLLQSVLASEAPQANLAVIVVGAQDCQNRDVYGAQMQMIDTATKLPVPTGNSAGDARSFYLDDNLPNTACTYTTNVGGRASWVMINAPTNLTPGATATTHDYEVQFSGRMSDSQPAATFINQTAVEAYPGTVTVLRSTKLNAVPPN